MNEKVKKYLAVILYQAIAAAVIFALLYAVDFFAPDMLEKIDAIWKKNTDLKKAGHLMKEILGELIPF